MVPLRGKLALITGGSRGIGLAIAKHFARQGASTILVARNAERLRNAVAAVQEAQGTATATTPTPPGTSNALAYEVPFCAGVTGDVASADMWHGLATKLDRGLVGRRQRRHRRAVEPPTHSEQEQEQEDKEDLLPDRVDILVNCAGITQESLLWRTAPEQIAAVLDTNLRGAVLACKYISKQMAKKHDGMQDVGKGEASIINVSSVMATMGGAGASVYAASKAGLLGESGPGPPVQRTQHASFHINTSISPFCFR